MTLSGLAFLFLWDKFESCEINLGCNFIIKKKNVALETPPVESRCSRPPDLTLPTSTSFYLYVHCHVQAISVWLLWFYL